MEPLTCFMPNLPTNSGVRKPPQAMPDAGSRVKVSCAVERQWRYLVLFQWIKLLFSSGNTEGM